MYSSSSFDSILSTAPQTNPTWAVPFFRNVSSTPENPVSLEANSILASFGDLKLDDIITKIEWEILFPNRAGVNSLCYDRAIYAYEDFIEAAKTFPRFANEGPNDVRKREVAAFLANASQETNGGSGSYEFGSDRYLWGLCWAEELAYADSDELAYRDEDHPIWSPYPNQSYYGRGPLQITWNFNYGQADEDLGIGILENPDLVLASGENAFKTALWFWMKEQFPKPSPHDAIIEVWEPTQADKNNNRYPGFGVTINIINGGGECGTGSENHNGPKNRLGYYNRYTTFFNIEEGNNIDCYNQHDFTFQ